MKKYNSETNMLRIVRESRLDFRADGTLPTAHTVLNETRGDNFWTLEDFLQIIEHEITKMQMNLKYVKHHEDCRKNSCCVTKYQNTPLLSNLPVYS